MKTTKETIKETTKAMTKAMVAGFMILDLQKLKSDAEEIAGSWNGEDDKFIADGDIYTEDDAHIAIDIMETCERLEGLLDEWAEIN